jgi:hypothetical protein
MCRRHGANLEKCKYDFGTIIYPSSVFQKRCKFYATKEGCVMCIPDLNAARKDVSAMP